MPAVVVDADGDIGKTGVAVTVDKCPQQSEVGVDGVFRSDRDVQRQVVGHARHLGGVGESARAGEHVSRRRGVDAEAAQRISEIRVDDRLVARQPVEVRTRRLERGVEGGQVQIAGQIQGRFQKVESRGSGEGDRVDVGAVIQQKLLRRKRTHAVRDDHDRQAGMVRFRPGDQPD